MVGMNLHDFWLDVWSVLVVVLGQELPDKAEPVIDQAFALLIAATGLAAFALVLALVEQVREALREVLHVGESAAKECSESDLASYAKQAAGAS